MQDISIVQDVLSCTENFFPGAISGCSRKAGVIVGLWPQAFLGCASLASAFQRMCCATLTEQESTSGDAADAAASGGPFACHQ